MPLLLALTCLIAQTGAPSSHVALDPAARLSRAHQHIEALDYRLALDDLNDVIGDERASEEQLLEAHLWAGIVQRVLQNDVDARLHFSWVLKRRPSTSLPPDQPPKVTVLFEMIRDEVESREIETEPSPSPSPSPSPAPAATAVTPAPAPAPLPAPTDDDGFAIITIGGGAVAALGAAAVVAGAITWGAGIAMFAFGSSQSTQVAALQWSAPSEAAQLAGQIILPVGAVVLVIGGATTAVGLLVE
jgi:hypothetical protein